MIFVQSLTNPQVYSLGSLSVGWCWERALWAVWTGEAVEETLGRDTERQEETAIHSALQENLRHVFPEINTRISAVLSYTSAKKKRIHWYCQNILDSSQDQTLNFQHKMTAYKCTNVCGNAKHMLVCTGHYRKRSCGEEGCLSYIISSLDLQAGFQHFGHWFG